MPLGAPKVYRLDNWRHLSNPARVAVLRRIGEEAGADPRLRRLAISIFRAAGVQPRDYRGQAQALLRALQDQVFFINEKDEVLQDPVYTLDLQPDGTIGRLAAGDCDDKLLAFIALCSAIHFHTRIVTSGMLGAKKVRWIEGIGRSPPAKFSHIYATVGPHPFRPAYDPKTWKFADATIRGVPLGWDCVGQGQSDPQFGDAGELAKEAKAAMNWRTALTLVGVSVLSTAVIRQMERRGWL